MQLTTDATAHKSAGDEGLARLRENLLEAKTKIAGLEAENAAVLRDLHQEAQTRIELTEQLEGTRADCANLERQLSETERVTAEKLRKQKEKNGKKVERIQK